MRLTAISVSLFSLFILVLFACTSTREQAEILINPSDTPDEQSQISQSQKIEPVDGVFTIETLGLNITAVDDWQLYSDDFRNYSLSEAITEDVTLYNSITIQRFENNELNQGLYESGMWGEALGIMESPEGDWTKYAQELQGGENENDQMFIFVLERSDFFYELHVPSYIYETEMTNWFSIF